MTKSQWNEVLYKNMNVLMSKPFEHSIMFLCFLQVSKHLQDALRTKLLG